MFISFILRISFLTLILGTTFQNEPSVRAVNAHGKFKVLTKTPSLTNIASRETRGIPLPTKVTPDQIQRSISSALNLTINGLHPLTGQYLCVFTVFGKTFMTDAIPTELGLSCLSPSLESLPTFPYGHHSVTTTLSVKTIDGPEFAWTNFTFFDCATYWSCSSCVSSPFSCDWCIDSHGCTYDAAEKCRNEKLNGLSVGATGAVCCPRITGSANGSSEILVPDGMKKSIRVAVDAFGRFITQTGLVCRFNVEGRIRTVDASLDEDVVYCDAMEFTYTQHGPNMTVTLAVVWGGSKPLDNPYDVHVQVYRCSGLGTSVKECLNVEKKYGCVWCQSTNRCEFIDHCEFRNGTYTTLTTGLEVSTNRNGSQPLSAEVGLFLSIKKVIPKEVQITVYKTLEITIEDMPAFDYGYLCVFKIMSTELRTNATRSKFGITCPTPSPSQLPSVQYGHDQIVSTLTVITGKNTELASTNFTFFDCRSYTTCTVCVSSPFPCDWCVDNHRCTHDTAENCRNDILVIRTNLVGPNYQSGPYFCPTINATTDGSSEILVPAGTKKGIRVKIHIFGQFIVQTRYLCQCNIEGRVTSVNADLIGDTIYCEAMEFTYTQRGPNMTATFAVIWGGSKPLDNPNNIHVVIYRCRDMAENCGMCLSLDKKYRCGWCQSTNRCEINSKCESGLDDWLDQNHTCPN